MTDDDFKTACFDKAEAGLLTVINWMEGCRKDNIIANLTENKIDKLKIMDVVFDINANINNLSLMYASLFDLSKTYSKLFASFMDRKRISKVMENFESMKETASFLRESLSANLGEAIELKNLPAPTETVHQEDYIIIDEPEASRPNIFEHNFFANLAKIETFSDAQFISDFLQLVSKLYKILLATFMLCRTIIQEEARAMQNTQELESIYNQSLNDVLQSLEELMDTFHEEDFQEEMTIAKNFIINRPHALVKYFHTWSLKKFKRHAIATFLLKKQKNNLLKMTTSMLFPDNPDKEQAAIIVARSLDLIITKTRKVNHSDKRQFATRSLACLKEQLGYKGSMGFFLSFLKKHYKGDIAFPDISALCKDSERMQELERKRNTADGKAKQAKLETENLAQDKRIKDLLTRNKTLDISPKSVG